MNAKRIDKLDPLKHRSDLFHREGDPDAPVGVISWGGVAGIALEAVRTARAQGLPVKLLVPKLLYPIAEDVYRDFFTSLEHCIVVEQSYQGQLHRLIRMWVDVPRGFASLCRSGANPFSPAELVEMIARLAPAVANALAEPSASCSTP
jgi:2-oxoglutarate/2-oxoacid ferredoxin oxidoreductase subunit alpha